ncbi:hypothetical protein BY996DRAFT_6453662, partial [Phakopsora pachyrhizi]
MAKDKQSVTSENKLTASQLRFEKSSKDIVTESTFITQLIKGYAIQIEMEDIQAHAATKEISYTLTQY